MISYESKKNQTVETFTQKNVEEWIQDISSRLPNLVSKSREEHIRLVAKISLELSKSMGYQLPEKAFLVGLCHDATKQKKPEFHKDLLHRYGKSLTGIPEPAFHSFSASYFLWEEIGLWDEEMRRAIESHTIGMESFEHLSMVLYAADFLGSDFARKQTEYLSWYERTRENLFFGVALKAKYTILNLVGSGHPIHPRTLVTYNKAIQETEKHL